MFLPAPPLERGRADDDRFDGQRRAPQHFADLVEDTPRQIADDEQVDVAPFVLGPAGERTEDVDRRDREIALQTGREALQLSKDALTRARIERADRRHCSASFSS